MGRVFEKRKHKIFARNAKLAKIFTKLSKEIVMAAKLGPDPETNPKLRMCIKNARAAQMPMANVEAAIARANNKDQKALEEVVYEGYGPGGVAILVETATDNTTRTVANIRMYLTRGGGTLGKSGSLDFIFSRKGVFEINPNGKDLEELELELIDFGLEEIEQADDKTFIYVPFNEFGTMNKALEDLKIEVISAELIRIPNSYAEGITPEQKEEIYKMIEKIEDDEDVQEVYHNMKEDEE
jgi:YebC/PmpR family DNA-binding regulatory protein